MVAIHALNSIGPQDWLGFYVAAGIGCTVFSLVGVEEKEKVLGSKTHSVD